MGVVYQALRTADGGLVALKTIKPAVDPTPVEIDRFLREAQILSELDHPNIVSFHELGESNGLLYFAMDYVAGTDAAQLLKQHRGPLPIARAVDLVCQLLRALDYAHARGFVHLDVKPSNMLVTQEGGRDVVRLSDFGLARIYLTSKMSGLSSNDECGGTAPFMAPEQINDLRGQALGRPVQRGRDALQSSDRPVHLRLSQEAAREDHEDPARRPRADPRPPSRPSGGVGRESSIVPWPAIRRPDTRTCGRCAGRCCPSPSDQGTQMEMHLTSSPAMSLGGGLVDITPQTEPLRASRGISQSGRSLAVLGTTPSGRANDPYPLFSASCTSGGNPACGVAPCG